METDNLDEKDIERVLTMLNSKNVKLLSENFGESELDSIFYGVKQHLLLIIKNIRQILLLTGLSKYK
ncbi:hypothetical protein NBO_491g0001 [Nosema bombycis CQ1]|uniref:Uncharacterized protein n=1 Tax=Nosema bombycis (strain CQ1 / CVCC 102059) TaxID=578461 RepID=R0M2H2_NOSB1|nr:hypothetical protein NBO_491g0001 [Nosema bombycis CQ1]|eukprot:EOB12239.1 hypothetical protein NBO_491g0001 [Nosema bombycis CQ1]